MNKLLKTISAFAIALLPATAMAQTFSTVDARFYPKGEDLVDSLLISDKVLGTAPKAGKVYYCKNVTLDAVRTMRGSYIFHPNMYYIISELPGNAGRYYGFYTSGHNNLQEVLSSNSTSTAAKEYDLVYGTVVRPDGTREEIAVRPESEWKKLETGKPTGTFYIDQPDSRFKTLELTFYAGGTGKATYYMPRTMHQAPQEIAGMSTQRYASGRVKKHHRTFSGGYWFYMDGKATVNIKWSLADGLLTITPVGKFVTNVTGGIDQDRTWANQHITESDKRIENGKHRADFPTNEYVKEAKSSKLETLNDYTANMGEMKYNVRHVTKNEIMMANKSNNYPGTYYFFAKRSKDDADFVGYGLENLHRVYSKFKDVREFGVDRLYQLFVNNAKVGLGMAPAPLSQAVYYQVVDINPADRTATVKFIVPNKEYKAKLKFDNRWHLDNAALQSSLEECTDIPDLAKTIAANHARIMEYKKDKRRAKIVKKYEKFVKDGGVDTSYDSIEEYTSLMERLKYRIEYQKGILKDLE